MSEVKLPMNVEAALENLNAIIEGAKTVPLKNSQIIVDKDALQEIYTKINRERNRIQELKNEYLVDAEEKSKAIIAEARLTASKIVEAAVSNTPLEEDANIKIALEIKENAMQYLEQTLNRLNNVMSTYDQLFSEVKAHVVELDNKKM